ncbi:uncharacterized protein YdhG (YjbR/CyaY superfamily) [Kibdelosporangium banguiense]|uniref:Uncharacterized protein YdhG (YjbR/CyaY superfamily) n=1 Tax=Kibdelosporangium banguiense TaxID=1365924 RepID=A0ABS4U255_9PSEU|nr:DUF1801 domain-containing protein [Kibdelosporangium banguiense]MBP2330727.1 uncharacterized protein YdhG (YjbR/CyaY superfamily) [Kibdelosporangium banguiense]
MVQSSAADVDTFLDEVTPERQAALRRIRQLCLQELTGFTESMQYGMPTYSRDGEGSFAFASQKQYISLYIRADVRDAHAPQLANHDMGKSCLRFRTPDKIDFDLLQSLLQATARKVD